MGDLQQCTAHEMQTVWTRSRATQSLNEGPGSDSVISSRFPVFQLGVPFFTLSGVSEFLVEVCRSRASAGVLGPAPDDVSQAADRLSGERRRVRHVRFVFVPEDEPVRYLFAAQYGEVIVEVAAGCGLRFERLVDAVSAWSAHPTNLTTKGEEQ